MDLAACCVEAGRPPGRRKNFSAVYFYQEVTLFNVVGFVEEQIAHQK
jgi:hypothetical protein